MARWNRVNLAELPINAVDAKFASTCVADDLPRSVDGLGLCVEQAAGTLSMRTLDGPLALVGSHYISVTWFRHLTIS
jgi:hypothetical protein